MLDNKAINAKQEELYFSGNRNLYRVIFNCLTVPLLIEAGQNLNRSGYLPDFDTASCLIKPFQN